MVNMIDNIAMLLTAVGGLNWGIIAFFNTNLVELLLGGTVFERIVYGAVGIAAAWLVAKSLATL